MDSSNGSKRPHKLLALPYLLLLFGLIWSITTFVIGQDLGAFWWIVGLMGIMIALDLVLDLVYGSTPLRLGFWRSRL